MKTGYRESFLKALRRGRRGKKVKEYPEMHQKGFLTIECPMSSLKECDFGIQIAEDGRVWICVDGEVFLRFRPLL